MSVVEVSNPLALVHCPLWKKQRAFTDKRPGELLSSPTHWCEKATDPHTHSHTDTHSHTQTHTHTDTHRHRLTQTYKQSHRQIHTQSHRQTHIHRHTHTHRHRHIHTNKHTHSHTHTQTNTNTHTQSYPHTNTLPHTHSHLSPVYRCDHTPAHIFGSILTRCALCLSNRPTEHFLGSGICARRATDTVFSVIALTTSITTN